MRPLDIYAKQSLQLFFPEVFDKIVEWRNETSAKIDVLENGALGLKGKSNDVPLRPSVQYKEDYTCQMKIIGLTTNILKFIHEIILREKTVENVLHKVGGQMITVDDWVYSIETKQDFLHSHWSQCPIED